MIEVTEATATAGALKRLSDEGVSIWLDDLSRRRIESGNLAELVRTRHVVGVTTNPSIFQSAIGSGEGYEEQLDDLAVRGVTVDEAVRMMTTADVRAAADILRPVYDATGGRDGRVSIEVDPRLAHDTRATVAEANQLAWLVVERLGISYDEVVRQLEHEGVAKFEAAWQDLLDAVTKSMNSKGVDEE